MLSMHTRGLFVEFAGAVPRLGVMRSIENMFYHGVLRRLRRSDLRAVTDNGIHEAPWGLAPWARGARPRPPPEETITVAPNLNLVITSAS